MLVVSTGKERTKQEMSELFAQSGWELVDVKTGAGPLALFEGVKV
jgi:hypothetical protein